MDNSPITGDSEIPNVPYGDYSSQDQTGSEEAEVSKGKQTKNFYDTIESATKTVSSPTDPRRRQDDNTSIGQPSLLSGQISSKQYAGLVFSSKDNFENALANAALKDSELAKRLHQGFTLIVDTQTQNSIDHVHKEWVALTDVVNTVNGEMNKAIEKYNYGVSAKNPHVQTEQSVTDEINKDIEAYNNGDIDSDEMSQDIDQYNAYAEQRNQEIDKLNDMIDVYNKFVVEANAKIDDINSQLDSLGYKGERIPPLTPIPNVPEMPIMDNPPGDPPLETLPPRTTIDPVGTMPTPPSTDYIAKNSTVVQSQQQASIAMGLGMLESASKISAQSLENLAYLLKSVSKMMPTLPTGLPMQKEYDPVTGEAIGYSDVIKGLGQKTTDAMIAKEVLNESMKKFGVPFGDETFAKLAQLNVVIMDQNGLLASSSTMAKVGNALSSLKENDPAIGVASALSTLEGAKMVVESDMMRQSVQDILNDDPAFASLSPEVQSAITNDLTAVSNMTLLNSAAAQLSMALQAPGLSNQLVGQSLPNGTVGDKSFNDAISDPASQSVVGNSMSKNLQSGYGFSADSASKVAANSLAGTASAGPFSSVDSYANTLTSQLKLHGIGNTALARSLALNAVNDFSDFVTKKGNIKEEATESQETVTQRFTSDAIRQDAARRNYPASFSNSLRDAPLGEGEYDTAQAVIDAADIGRQLADRASPDVIAAALQGGGLDEELASALGGQLFDSLQASPLKPMTQQEALSVATEEMLTDTMMMDPATAQSAAQAMKGENIIKSKDFTASIAGALAGEGMNRNEAASVAQSVVEQTFAIPAAYRGANELKNTASALLQGYSGLDQATANAIVRGIDTTGLIDAKGYRGALSDSLQESGMGRESAQALALEASTQMTKPYHTFADQLASTLRATTGLDAETASSVATGISPDDVIDDDALQSSLEQQLKDNSISTAAAKTVVGQMLQLGSAYVSMGKFAETMRDLLVSDMAVDPKLAKQISQAVSVEGVIQKEALKEGIQSALADRGVSSESAASMAGRASDAFMRITSNATEFTGIGNMALDQRAERSTSQKFLSHGLSNVFSGMGMPDVYARELGVRITSDVYSAKENLSNFASLQKAIQISLQNAIFDESFPVDIEKYLGKNALDEVTNALSMVPPLRKEMIEENVKQAMLSEGVGEHDASLTAARCADVIMQTPNVLASSDEELRSSIQNRLLSVTSEQHAQHIANSLPLETLRDEAAALDNPFNNVLLGRDALAASLTERGTSLMQQGLGNEKAREINERIASALFGAPNLEGPSEEGQQASFVDLYQQQLNTLMDGLQNDELKNAMLDSVAANLQKFASPSIEMYDALQRLMEPSNLMVKSMVRTLQEAREQEESISISLRQGA